jgi:hypothetical protein
VHCGWTVAYFTCNVFMVSFTLDRHYIIVAFSTNLMAGVFNLFGNDFINSRSTEVAIFTEIRRNKKMPY